MATRDGVGLRGPRGGDLGDDHQAGSLSRGGRAKVDAFLDRFVGSPREATTIGLLAVADRAGLSAISERSAVAPQGWPRAPGSGADIEEIMSGLAAAGIVDYDPDEKRFDLPRACAVPGRSSPYFMGGFFDIIPAFLAQIDGVAAAHRSGGVRFEEYGEAAVRGIARAHTAAQNTFLVSRWLPAAGLTGRLEKGIRVADVGCGSGTAHHLMAAHSPKSQISGFDVSAMSIETARNRGAGSQTSSSTRTEWAMPTDPRFDLITTFDVIHDLADPLTGVRHPRSPRR